jgi:hypothetical protein
MRLWRGDSRRRETVRGAAHLCERPDHLSCARGLGVPTPSTSGAVRVLHCNGVQRRRPGRCQRLASTPTALELVVGRDEGEGQVRAHRYVRTVRTVGRSAHRWAALRARHATLPAAFHTPQLWLYRVDCGLSPCYTSRRSVGVHHPRVPRLSQSAQDGRGTHIPASSTGPDPCPTPDIDQVPATATARITRSQRCCRHFVEQRAQEDPGF